MAGARAQVDTIKIPDQNAEFLMEQNVGSCIRGIFYIMNVHPLRNPNHEYDNYLDWLSIRA